MAKPPFQVKALYDYKSPHEDDLSFPSAQIMTVTDEEDNDWYYGEFEDASGTKQEGLFPRNFVKPYEPETPPRPNRQTRAKKETASTSKATDAEKPTSPTEMKQEVSQASASQSFPVMEPEGPQESQEPEPESKPQPPPSIAIPPPTQTSGQAPPSGATSATRETKPMPPMASKGPPPPVTEKPASGSFRDRINAFNKSTAPPPAPSKPAGLGGSGGSGFVKKTFVAPPPSKNAYVPPPRQDAPHKVYRREEDPEVVAQSARNHDEEDVSVPQVQSTQAQSSQDNDSEDQPKPTSLKERIALLQKQQAEQASRHAEKKEKPKRPPKRQEEDLAAPEADHEEGGELERAKSNETTGKKSMDAARDPRASTRPRKSRDEAPAENATALPAREILSDGNDADQSGAADTGEEEDQSTGRDDSDDKAPRPAPVLPHRTPQMPSQEIESEGAVREGRQGEDEEEEEEEEEDEEDVDPEVKRRLEIRERMAKMSGGMGMAGMFGAPGGMPPKPAPRQGTGSSERKMSGTAKSEPAPEASRAPPVPIMPMPGLAKTKSPEVDAAGRIEPEVEKEESEEPRSIVHGRAPAEMPDVEDLREEPTPVRRSTDRAPPPPPPSQAREVPPLPSQNKGAPPLPTERPVPPPPATSRPVPPPPSQPLSPSEGSMSDDEMPPHPGESNLDEPLAGDNSRSASEEPSIAKEPPPAMPSRPKAPQSRPSELGAEDLGMSSPMPSTLPSQKRSSRVPPPIPGAAPAASSTPQSRAPPPPPPAAAPAVPSRTATSTSRGTPVMANSRGAEISDEEVTEYDGDYDTDMASGATHKDALKSHGRGSSLDDESMTEGEAAMHHIGLPSMGPQLSTPRAAPPPPPPTQPARPTRQSSDMPRAAPPPPPPAKEPLHDDQGDDYDPYNYTSRLGPRTMSGKVQTVKTPTIEEPDNMFASSVPQSSEQLPISPSMAAPSRSAQRQSSDIQRSNTSIRRSTDGARPSGEHGTMAADVDLGPGSLWWTQPNAPPPIFQNRRDILFETEEASVAKRGGKQAVTRTVYILFMDYSQTVITAQYEVHNPAIAHLEQTHEPPPRSFRQDQLEDAHSMFGARIAKDVETKKESVVGDGSPHALPLELISSMPNALLPVGTRAYGALVYANLANASVQQFDEIRPGDIITFRNAKFAGHRGTMHSKYSMDVGKPDHVAVVLDWDGTKKKARAWEQGRESKKVKPESFRFGDMKSGEVKVWRVMARSWVGWEGQN